MLRNKEREVFVCPASPTSDYSRRVIRPPSRPTMPASHRTRETPSCSRTVMPLRIKQYVNRAFSYLREMSPERVERRFEQSRDKTRRRPISGQVGDDAFLVKLRWAPKQTQAARVSISGAICLAGRLNGKVPTQDRQPTLSGLHFMSTDMGGKLKNEYMNERLPEQQHVKTSVASIDWTLCRRFVRMVDMYRLGKKPPVRITRERSRRPNESSNRPDGDCAELSEKAVASSLGLRPTRFEGKNEPTAASRGRQSKSSKSGIPGLQSCSSRIEHIFANTLC